VRALVAVALLSMAAALGCGSSSAPSAPVNEIPPELVPASAQHAVVTVTRGGASRTVPDDVVARVVPLLVRRVFEPTEPLTSYGLDKPAATVSFALPGGSTIELTIGGQDLDKSAYYVQRAGDGRVWLVLADSIVPLLERS
jgi:hypothetical protein